MPKISSVMLSTCDKLNFSEIKLLVKAARRMLAARCLQKIFKVVGFVALVVILVHYLVKRDIRRVLSSHQSLVRFAYDEVYIADMSQSEKVLQTAVQRSVDHNHNDSVEYHLIVEGTFFQMRGESLTGIAYVWLNLLKHLSESKLALASCPNSLGPQHKVIYIDRSPGDAGSRAISSYQFACENGTVQPAVIMVTFMNSLEFTIVDLIPKAIAAAGFSSTGYPVLTVYTSTYYTFPDVLSFPPTGLCTILYVHDTIPEEDGLMTPESQWWPRKLATQFVNSFICVSKSSMREYVRWYAPFVLIGNLSKDAALQLNDTELEKRTHITVVSNRLSSEEFPGPASEQEISEFKVKVGLEDWSTDQKFNYILALADRNYDLLLRAFDQLPDAIISKYSLLFTTSHFRPNTTTLSHLVDFNPKVRKPFNRPVIRIHSVGYLPRNLVRVALSGALALVYISAHEGFGLPVLEALASGTLVITSNWSSMPEVAGDAAFYVNKIDTAELTATLLRVVQLTAEQRLVKIRQGLNRARLYGGTFGRASGGNAWEDAAVQFVNHMRSKKHKGEACYGKQNARNLTRHNAQSTIV